MFKAGIRTIQTVVVLVLVVIGMALAAGLAGARIIGAVEEGSSSERPGIGRECEPVPPVGDGSC